MKSTIKEVASYANVSQATVSRVINKKGYVSESVRKRVLDAVQELDYTPSLMASSLSKSKVNIIGVIVPDICNSFFSQIFYAAGKVAEENGYRVILYNTDDNIEMETMALHDMISYKVSGIIMTPVSDKDTTNAPLINQIKESGIAVVFVDREMNGIDCDGVYIENIRISHEAVTLLLEEGHRDIAIVAGPLDTIPGRERMMGYTTAMKDWGLKLRNEYLLDGDFKTEKSYQKVKELLQSENPPTAIFSCNNLMTLGCLHAIRESNRKIPDDIALIGFDEIELLDILGFEITVISRAIREMGSTAMNILLNRITKDESIAYQRVVLKSQIKLHGSEKKIK